MHTCVQHSTEKLSTRELTRLESANQTNKQQNEWDVNKQCQQQITAEKEMQTENTFDKFCLHRDIHPVKARDSSDNPVHETADGTSEAEIEAEVASQQQQQALHMSYGALRCVMLQQHSHPFIVFACAC